MLVWEALAEGRDTWCRRLWCWPPPIWCGVRCRCGCGSTPTWTTSGQAPLRPSFAEPACDIEPPYELRQISPRL